MLNEKNNGWAAALLAATAASLCCITPFLAFLGGAGSIATAFSWIQPYRPYLAGITAAIFALAWYQKLKPRKPVDCNCDTEGRAPFRQSKTFLGIVTVIAVLLIAFPYYGKNLYPKPVAAKTIPTGKSKPVTILLHIGGMDCEACTAHINGELTRQYGVFEANTSYENAIAAISFDSSKTTAKQVANVIRSIGYTVTSIETQNK